MDLSESRALLERLDERTERIVKVLEGNGKRGLVDRVDYLESYKDKAKGMWYAVWTIITIVLGLLGIHISRH